MEAASVKIHTLSKEATNYARLCRLLVVAVSQVLRDTFDKIHPPERLHYTLSSHPVRAFLESLYTGNQKILNREQWRKLYPSAPSTVSSQNFDITLLTLLLRNISGLKPPATGWNSPPPATDTSIEADITRLKVLRNEVYGHGSRAFVNDLMFDRYWQDIQQTLIRLGGEHYGPHLEKGDCMGPDIGLHYQELLKEWIEDEGKIDQIEGNVGCLYAETEDISLLEPSVDFKSTSKHGTARAALRTVITYLRSLRKPKSCVSAACGAKEVPLNKELNSHEVSARNGINRIASGMCHTEETRRANEAVVALLDEAINLQQSNHIAGAREKLRRVFRTIRKLAPRFFSNPTEDGLRVLRRGKELFLEDSVSCSVKHGTLLFDSSNPEAQFYSSLLHVIGAFAVVISEVKMAKEIFSLLNDFHQQSAVTSRKLDLGASYNNTGCISLILGDLKQAEHEFKMSLKHLESAKERHQLHNLSLETMSIAVNSNISRLHQLSRNYSKAIEKQEQLVETCKTKVKEVPHQVVFTLLNNVAVLYTTLGKFSKAEQELKWLALYCHKLNREDCDFLFNFVELHLSEVFLLHGNPKEAEKAFRFHDDIDYAEMFGGLHINVRIETVEKLIDVIVLKGKIRFARELLNRGVNTLKTIFGPDHFNVASLLYKQGTILTLDGDVSEAAEKFKCSIEILEVTFGIKHPLLLECYMSLGELALRSERADESYIYFQRAMENVEAMYQVSFVNQLSWTYLEITSSKAFHRSKMLEDAWKIEGLVAEYGVVLAVLTRPLRRSKTKLKQPLSTNNRDVQCPESKEIVSFRYTSDFLQTGQTFLRQGMKKEAAAFFQQARKYSIALDATRGPSYACIARLYDVLTEERLRNRQPLETKHEISRCLEELSEVSTKIGTANTGNRSTEEATTTALATGAATIDDQLNLKLVLIFLILLSIELKMMETTFAAYDLYSRISQNEDSFLYVLNGEVQVYASKTSITCNGKTALQDVLVSTVSLNENDFQRPLPDKELYRSLAFKKNVPTDSFLVAYTSSVFLDIEELRALDRKISLSVQECFQQKCFESGAEDGATQVVVDLTTMPSFRDHRDVLLAGSRMELLSVCLSQGATSEVPQGGNISEISTAMYLKTVHLTFDDEQTSHFMFSKNALYLLQQCNSGNISILSVKHQCLSLTITHPVKARLTLWRKDRSISQKVQLVQTATRHDMADRTVPKQRCFKELLTDFGLAERIFWPAIDHWANAYQVPCKTDVDNSDQPPDVSDVYCKQNSFFLDGRPTKERQDFSLRMDQSESLRNNLNASILEGLTFVSELSSQLHGDTIHKGDEDIVVDSEADAYADADADTDAEDTSCLPTSSQVQFQQEVTSSDCRLQPSTLNPEANIQSRNLSMEVTNLAGEEVTPETRKTYPMPREEEDDNLLGRSLFEKDRDSRRSLIVELQNEIASKSKLMSEQDGSSDEVTQQVDNCVIDPRNTGKCHTTSSPNHPTRMDISNSTFENGTSKTEDELRTQSLMEPQSKLDPKDDEEALERHLLEKDRQSTGASITKLKGPKIEEVLPTWNNKPPANEDSAEDKGLGKQYRSNYRSSTHGQTQHLQDVTQRQTKHTILEEGKDRALPPMEMGEEYIFQRRDERESRDGQNKSLVDKDFSQALISANPTKREKSRSSSNVYEDTVPDGPIGTSKGIHSNSIDLIASRNTDVVDGPLQRVGNSLQIQSGLVSENADGLLTSGRQIVDGANCEELQRGTRRDEKLRASQRSSKDTNFRNPQPAFLGGNVLVQGDATDSFRMDEKMVDGPVLTGEASTICQDGYEKICGNEMSSFPSNAARDEVDGRVYSRKSDANIKDPPGSGGAISKQISRNSTKRNSSTKTEIPEPISTYQHKVLSRWNDKLHANEDSAEDQGLNENQQFENSSVPGQSARMAKDELKQSFIGNAMHDLMTQNRKDNVTLDNQYRSSYCCSTHGQTQHLQDVTQRQTTQIIIEEKRDETMSPMELREGYIFQRRVERESRDGQNKPLVDKDFSQAFIFANPTKREKSRSSFNVYEDIVPDGPIGTSNGIHNNSIDLMASRNTDVVDGPLQRVGNGLQIQSSVLTKNADGILTSRRQIVDGANCEELQRGTWRNEYLPASQKSRKDTSFRNPQLAFLGGNVLVDGGAKDPLRKEDKMVHGPVLTGEAFTTCQDGTEKICENEMSSFPSDAARDEVDGCVYSNGKDPQDFGGARPKQISRNSTKRNSSTKTKITEPISTCQHKETGEFGLEPGFLERHTAKSNEAILDLPPQDGWYYEPYFASRACKNITYGDNLRLPGEGINPRGYKSSTSSEGLYALEAFAARTQNNAQSLAVHQKPSLNEKESWHFPPQQSPVLQSNFSGDQGLCVSQQSASQSKNSIICYDGMDSMSNDYHSNMGNVDNRLVNSPAVSDGQNSSTEDSTSSLLGSLQQIMSKTINLIASGNAVTKQPQKEPKEAIKLSIQEEARGRREQAVTTRVEDSRNQDESTQGNEAERQPIPTPVQETPRPVCSHYQRRCLVRFPCCGKFYPCHRCHNESKDCSDDQARATNATHIRCSICYHEQEIDDQSQNCGGCKSKMSDYFCATCKHFTSVDKNPFHCDKCGICRIHRDRSFHCDVCNVCLDKRLQGKHKCRPDSGHDECCICLEDAFSGCQILPCSHKVHKDCAIAMIQNGVRSCPICRHPLFGQPQNSPQ